MTSRSAQRKANSNKKAAGKKPPGRGKAASRGRTSPSRRNAIVVIGVVCLAAVAIIGIGILRNPASAPVASESDAAEAIRLVTNVPAAALDAGSVGSGISPPTRLAGDVPPFTQDGKPAVLYVGAEYCPYCAAQRWPLIVALSRFGTFNGLGMATSSPTDVFPDTATFTFHGATYSSPYLVFSAVEEATSTGGALETPTAEQQALLELYDAPPYTSSAGAIPFLMIGNRYVQIGSSFQPDGLAGLSQVDIARQLADPGANPTAEEILGSADVMTAAICQLTNGVPADVCQSPGVTQAAQSLPRQAPG